MQEMALIWLYLIVQKILFFLTIDVIFGKLEHSKCAEFYQETTGFKTSGRKLERLLKLVTGKFQNNATSFVAHTNL
jgi:hypothetical protein